MFFINSNEYKLCYVHCNYYVKMQMGLQMVLKNLRGGNSYFGYDKSESISIFKQRVKLAIVGNISAN